MASRQLWEMQVQEELHRLSNLRVLVLWLVPLVTTLGRFGQAAGLASALVLASAR